MKRYGMGVLIAACLLVFLVDYPWGDLQDHPHWAKVFQSPIKVSDFVLNALLGMPLGLATPWVFRRGVLAAVLIATPVSVAAEWSQIYSHTRFPSFIDVALNVFGAFAAALFVTATKGRNPGRPQ